MTESVTEKHLRFTVVFILVARASHDSSIGTVNIPFPFRIDNTELDSGRYIVRLDNNQLKFGTKDSSEDTDCVDCLAVTAAAQTESACGTLAFVECGRRYILCKAFWPLGWSKHLSEKTTEALNGFELPFQGQIEESGYQLQTIPCS
jgi:hypothetical protein